jgi:hypothetical protein
VPHFLIIGAQRSGTTSLYAYLTQHPLVVPAVRKEVRYFDRHFANGIDWYRAQLRADAASGRQTGEATPYYLFHPLVPGRVAACAPRVKLVVLLRNPVDRAHSHFQHEVRRGFETLSFDAAIAAEPERLADETERILADDRYPAFNHLHYSYLARGHYAVQLRTWLAEFPRDQLLVLESEGFYRDPGAAVGQVCAFLGLPRIELGTFAVHNGAAYPPMAEATRRRLSDHFAAANRELVELLGVAFSWTDPAAAVW